MRFVPFLALMALASPVFAQDTPAPKKEDRMICRSTGQTGSILGGKRECHTKAEWAKISETSSKGRERQDRNTRIGGSGVGVNRQN